MLWILLVYFDTYFVGILLEVGEIRIQGDGHQELECDFLMGK